MEKFNIKIDILPNYFLNDDKTFNKEEAIKLCGKIAGVCYDKEGFNHLLNENEEKTMRRVDMTLNNGHHSVYDHIFISFNLQNVPKILAMILNNEKEYTTSEKSARYTKIECNNSVITKKEEELYNKWLTIFKCKIKESYSDVFNDSKIEKLAQENARYLVTVFMPTQMIYTTSLRQINYITSWMIDYIESSNKKTPFEKKVSMAMDEFINCLDDLNVLEPGLMKNEKKRDFSLFASNIKDIKPIYDNIYQTTYMASFASLAQAQRHRTLNYSMEMTKYKTYFVPPIIKDDSMLVYEWLSDMNSVRNVTPQGELVMVLESGTYDDFILKCKERLCSCAQLEIMNQTKETLIKYKKELEENKNGLYNDILNYSNGARCTFPSFTCSSDCKFKEGKLLVRKI